MTPRLTSMGALATLCLTASCTTSSGAASPSSPLTDAGHLATFVFDAGNHVDAASPRDALADRTTHEDSLSPVPDAAHDRAAPADAGSSHADTGSSHADTGRTVDSATTHDAGGPGSDAGCTACARDWALYPPVAQLDGASELWVVSDIHADYAAATKLLTAAHILSALPSSPSKAEWAGGSATFVIVGDSIDKGPDAPGVLSLIMALQASAPAAAGHVIMTMGNHEAEFLANPENSSATGTNGIDSQLPADALGLDATAAGDDPLGAFLRNLPIAARVDDWFFVHAGDTGGATVAELTTEIENGVNDAGFAASVLIGDASMLEARLGKSPPQWWDTTGDATALLTAWTSALGVKHLVMGHQPGAVGISGGANRPAATMAAEYGGLLFLIDTGMSVDVDATGGALLHVTGVGTASEAWAEVLPDGSTMTL